MASASTLTSAAHVQEARGRKQKSTSGIPRESCCCKWNFLAPLTHPAAQQSQPSRTKSRRQVLAALKDHQRASERRAPKEEFPLGPKEASIWRSQWRSGGDGGRLSFRANLSGQLGRLCIVNKIASFVCASLYLRRCSGFGFEFSRSSLFGRKPFQFRPLASWGRLLEAFLRPRAHSIGGFFRSQKGASFSAVFRRPKLEFRPPEARNCRPWPKEISPSIALGARAQVQTDRLPLEQLWRSHLFHLLARPLHRKTMPSAGGGGGLEPMEHRAMRVARLLGRPAGSFRLIVLAILMVCLWGTSAAVAVVRCCCSERRWRKTQQTRASCVMYFACALVFPSYLCDS